ncbi:MAG: substrate-binding domain-containing protein [Trueperaceae bacterium]
MLQAERENEILTAVNETGSASVRSLAQRFRVTEATVRRDLQRLEDRRQLRRIHGGALRLSPDGPPTIGATAEDLLARPQDTPDGLIVAPIENTAARALRQMALRQGIPLLAESAPQSGAVYLGPDNFAAALALSRWVTAEIRRRKLTPTILCVSHDELANAAARRAGLLQGLREAFGEQAEIVTVDGGGLLDQANQVAQAALRVQPAINVILGVNDDSVLGALHACAELGRETGETLVAGVGGEGPTLFGAMRRGAVHACVSLLPKTVGATAIDSLVRSWHGEELGAQIITPWCLYVAAELPAGEGAPVGPPLEPLPENVARHASGKHVEFIVQFRTHEWYQEVAKAMRERAQAYGATFTAHTVGEGLEREVRELRQLIGKEAAAYVRSGESLFLDGGQASCYAARFLAGKRTSVTTHSLAVFNLLHNLPEIQLRLTGGDYHREQNLLHGQGAVQAVAGVRVDKLLLSVDGASERFGLSSASEHELEVLRAMVRSAREVVVLAVHTAFGVDANFHIAGLGSATTVITDSGLSPETRLELSRRGIRVIIASQEIAP